MIGDSGYGQEVKNALAQSRQWLIAQGLAEERQGHVLYQCNLLTILRRRELTRAAAQLSQELGLAYSEVPIMDESKAPTAARSTLSAASL